MRDETGSIGTRPKMTAGRYAAALAILLAATVGMGILLGLYGEAVGLTGAAGGVVIGLFVGTLSPILTGAWQTSKGRRTSAICSVLAGGTLLVGGLLWSPLPAIPGVGAGFIVTGIAAGIYDRLTGDR